MLVSDFSIYLYIYKQLNMDTKKLTSVKVEQELFQEFKEECIRHKFSLQKLVDRAIFLYLTEEEFKKKLHSQINIKLK
jgi:hypothetical protein